MRFRNDKGFTLIELMVVILIIGILVAIAVPVFNSSREAAYKRTCQANLRTIDGAIQTYKADTGTSAATIAALSPTYIKTTPICPKPGAAAYTLSQDLESAICTTYSGAPTLHTYP